MLLIKIFPFINLFYYIILFINKVFSYDLVIDSNDENYPTFADTVNNLLNNDDVQLLFNEDYYKLPLFGRSKFNILNNLTFYSKNGTIFDFQQAETSTLYFSFVTGIVDKKIVFRNITFYNFDGFNTKLSAATHFTASDKTDRFTVVFDNCIFKNNKKLSFYSHVSCTKSDQKTPQIIFNNCKFLYVFNIFNIYYNLEHINNYLKYIFSCS